MALALSGPAWTQTETAPEPACTLVVDVDTGKPIHVSGDCDRRHSPASTFKVPLAVMGFDAGILVDSMNPLWELPEAVPGQLVGVRLGTPTSWQQHSLVWYSRELTRTLGRARLEQYVLKFAYGNKDASAGIIGRPGTDSAWIGGSLAISAREQTTYLRKLVREELPVSARAQQAAKAIIPRFRTDAGWAISGKTGSTWTYSRAWVADKNEPIGWFVGWASLGNRNLVFARVSVGQRAYGVPMGLLVRKQFLDEFDALVEGRP
ncbi:penicillin-binding transpeptidase domain-containing protein [Hydrogenophaga borbori]|uniref:penicillin-binding transpeptidase domain-containing protein n=1 Tax=Hydrogenophaga borbori TaxID=2294117 RepID=UPI00301C104B